MTAEGTAGRNGSAHLGASLLTALKDHGARQVFGIPGDFVLAFFKVIEESDILPLHTLSHEPAVGFAADAAARVAGGLGVAVVTYGAGALNVVNPSPKTVWAVARHGGVFRSGDGGTTWKRVLSIERQEWAALAVDPKGVAYAGADTTGPSPGVQRSSDGGASWKHSEAGFPHNFRLTALAVDSKAPATLYAGTSDGVFKSLDSGANWTFSGADKLGKERIRALAVDPVAPATVWAGINGGFFRSDDFGKTWAKKSPEKWDRCVRYADETQGGCAS